MQPETREAGGSEPLTIFQVIGYNVERLAKKRGWNDEQLAVYAGVTRTTVSNVIRGHPVRWCLSLTDPQP